jgi:D-arabinose 1-dehydrogenase-like Zn-dependent alcohol dehydrogenase
MKALTGTFDLIIDTSPANADVGPYMDILKFNGTYCSVGIPAANGMHFKYSYISLIFTQKKIAGSIITGTRRMYEMLELVDNERSKYMSDPDDWKADIVQFDKVNEVMDDLCNGRNSSNYRYILKW